MDFKFTEDQEMLRAAFREFVEAEVAPHAAEWDEEDRCPIELWPKMAELGINGLFAPEKYSGVGLGQVERLIAMEEIARHSAGLAIAMFTHHLAVKAFDFAGTDEQNKKYLVPLCDGSKIGGVAVTEPGGGSDMMGHKTTAEFKDGKWILNGRKCFITNSHTADITVVTARTGEDAKGRPELSAFIVETGTPGFAPGRKENKLGLRGSTTGDLILDNVELTEDKLLGKRGQGGAIAMNAIGVCGRGSIGAMTTGILRGCLEDSVKFAQERIVYGKPIAKLQAIQFHIAENRIDYEAQKLLAYRAASIYDSGDTKNLTNFSIAKHHGTEAACRASKRTIELMGGYGVINEYPVGRYLRDSIALISAGGTSEIQRIIVAGDTLSQWSK